MNKMLTAIALVIATVSFAQKGNLTPCGFDNEMDHLMRNSKAKSEIDLINRRIAEIKENSGSAMKSTAAPFVIPVVFYIVHNNEAIGTGTNIADSRVIDQIAALNTYFSPANIKFCLATKTASTTSIPLANVTHVQNTAGIIHVNSPSATNHTQFVTNPLTSLAHSSITPDKFLRIWVVNSIDGSGPLSGIQGYSPIPLAFSGFDGVVIRYDRIGSSASTGMIAGYNQGKTLTHELGHYLGLWHTFQGSCETPHNDCQLDGDFVCDTPTVSGPNYYCTTNTNSCPETPVIVDDIHNFMDYGNDNCSDHFTVGQRTRMRNILIGWRQTLISTENQINAGTCGSANLVSATFTADRYAVCTGSSVLFVPNTNPADATYFWNFGDGATSNLPSVSHPYASAVNSPYTVTLTITKNNVSYTSTAQIFVSACSPINNQDSNWYVSRSAGVSFNTGIPQFIPSFPETNTGNYCIASQSNTSGQLLFYTNSLNIYNSSHQQINTTSINAPSAFIGPDNFASLIIPKPGNANQYYIFSNFYDPNHLNVGGLRYSTVNVSGTTATMGSSISQPVTFPSTYVTNTTDGAVIGGSAVAAIFNCNTQGYWILTTLKKGSNFYLVSYSLTSTGLGATVNEMLLPTDQGGKCSITVAPNGNKIFLWTELHGAKHYLVDFEKAAGTFSNVTEVKVSSFETLGFTICNGACFSPDSKLLYVVDIQSKVNQLNLNAFDINASRKLVYSGDSLVNILNQMQLGPDGKIYISSGNTRKLAVIHNPNTLVTADNPNACNFSVNGPNKDFGTLVGGYGLPNLITAKSPTAYFAANNSQVISYYPAGCNAYKFFPNICGNNFIWSFTDTASGTTTNISQNTPTYAFLEGNYTVTLKSAASVVLGTVSLTIPSVPAPEINGLSTACLPSNSITNSSIVLLEGETVTWSVISGSGTLASPNNQSDISVNWTSLPGTIKAVHTNSQGCSVIVTKQIEPLCCTCFDDILYMVWPNEFGSALNFAIELDNEYGCDMYGTTNASVLWNYGDGSAPTYVTSHQFPATATYTVTATIYYEGCTTTISFPVQAGGPGTGPVGPGGPGGGTGNSKAHTPKQLKAIVKPIIKPNPSTGVFNLLIEKFSGKLDIQVYDLNGKLVYEKNQEEFTGEKSLDLSHLPSGTYVLRGSGQGTTFAHKIIKD